MLLVVLVLTILNSSGNCQTQGRKFVAINFTCAYKYNESDCSGDYDPLAICNQSSCLV